MSDTRSETFVISTKDVLNALNMIPSMPSEITTEDHDDDNKTTLCLNHFEQLQRDMAEYNALPGVVEIYVKCSASLRFEGSNLRRPIAYVRYMFVAQDIDDGLDPDELKQLLDVFRPYSADPVVFMNEMKARLITDLGLEELKDSHDAKHQPTRRSARISGSKRKTSSK